MACKNNKKITLNSKRLFNIFCSIKPLKWGLRTDFKPEKEILQPRCRYRKYKGILAQELRCTKCCRYFLKKRLLKSFHTNALSKKLLISYTYLVSFK